MSFCFNSISLALGCLSYVCKITSMNRLETYWMSERRQIKEQIGLELAKSVVGKTNRMWWTFRDK
jgi:hypothetical protein